MNNRGHANHHSQTTFQHCGVSIDSVTITYILVQEGESWKVDNMRSAKWDLRKLLKVPKG
jgi:hypothetical protein